MLCGEHAPANAPARIHPAQEESRAGLFGQFVPQPVCESRKVPGLHGRRSGQCVRLTMPSTSWTKNDARSPKMDSASTAARCCASTSARVPSTP